MELSDFGKALTRRAGIVSLMEDLGTALADSNDQLIMMGGGNPGQIDPVVATFRRRLQQIADSPAELNRFVSTYAPPAGEPTFRHDLARMLHRRFGWPITEANICLTHGSQSGFFSLFNMLGGQCGPLQRRIHLPMVPEYIGYSSCGRSQDMFTASWPNIVQTGEHTFRYMIDFEALSAQIDDSTAALCLSRPANPTGGMLCDSDIVRLDDLAAQHNIPLMIDSAYGQPFPGLVPTGCAPLWNERIILSLSLSKLGLPALRTGIVIAREEIIASLSCMTAIMSLAPGNAGCMMVQPMVRDDSLLSLCQEVISPWYEARRRATVDALHREMGDLPWSMHEPEGAMFVWLWLRDLPLTCQQLYERLKQRGLLVVAGHHFFAGSNPADTCQPSHAYHCIRLTCVESQERLVRGVEILAQELRALYG